MKNKLIKFLPAVLASLFLCACGTGSRYTDYTNEITIKIEGLDREYDYFLLNDTHLFIEDSEIRSDYSDLVSSRILEFSLDGSTSADNFKKWVGNLDEENLDGVILNSDIEDQLSKANLEYITGVTDKLTIPYMYLFSDHDLATDWTSPSSDDYTFINDSMIERGFDKGYSVFEEASFLVIGINRSWENISAETLDGLKAEFSKGKPVILVTHVPYDSLVSDDLKNLSKEQKGDRVLLWGFDEEDYYVPDANMTEFLNMVTADDSPVVAVLAAHLHAGFETSLTDSIPEYITGTGYNGVRTLVKIVPDD